MDSRQAAYGGAALLALVAFVVAMGFFSPGKATVVVYEPPTVATTLLQGPVELPSSTLAAVLASTPLAEKPEPVSLDAAAGATRNAVVNILCIPSGSPLKPVSGSGVLIDSRGIILTTAHIAQYFLLQDYPKKGSVSCLIRTGDPAVATFKADLIYASTEWITKNQDTLAEAKPLGTGESDFALLYATESMSGAALPRFPALPLGSKDLAAESPIVAGGYGAEFLDESEILDALSPIIDAGTVEKRYTFRKDSVDLLSVRGSEAAQVGSSGGAVTAPDATLAGLITTTSPESGLKDRSLRAITPSHIKERFKNDTDMDFDAFLRSGSPALLASSFKERMDALRQILIEAVSD